MRRLPTDIAERIVTAVDRLASTGQGDVRKLQDSKDDYRLRVGDYRVRFTYEIGQHARGLMILRVLNRREAYRGPNR